MITLVTRVVQTIFLPCCESDSQKHQTFTLETAVMFEQQKKCVVDENECDTPSSCSQICTDTIGSYKCECADMYELMPDRKTCKAESEFSTESEQQKKHNKL